MKLPDRDYLQFDELKEKWDCTSRDLFHLIATGKLTPSVLVDGRYEPSLLVGDHEGDLFAAELMLCDPSAVAEPLSGIFYLCSLSLKSASKCHFAYFSNKRSQGEGDFIYRIDPAVEIELDHVKKLVRFQGSVIFAPNEIERFESENKHPDAASSEKQTAYPWGTHSTKWLTHLAQAAEKFWSLYDPRDPSTAPTNDQVEKWLISRAVPKRTAEVMATILRADSLPTGRRKFE